MQLIILLIAFLAGRMSSGSDHLRRFNWFSQYVLWLEKHWAAYGIWHSAIGVLLPLILPSVLFVLLLYALNELSAVLATVFSVFVVFLCLKREVLVDSVHDYIEAYKENDQVELNIAGEKITVIHLTDKKDETHRLLDGFFTQSLFNIFGVIVWFMVLGVLGAFLYKLSYMLYLRQYNIKNGFSDSVNNLFLILNWPVTYLVLLSVALVGSLSDAYKATQRFSKIEFYEQLELLSATAKGAMQFDKNTNQSIEYCLKEALGLINRALVLWLAIIAFSTIQGWFY